MESPNPNTEIVGVVGDAKFVEMRTEAPPTLYLPILQRVGLMGTMHFELRTAGNPRLLVPAVRRAAQELDRNLALYEVQTQQEQIDRALFQERLFVRLTAFFALLATLLACVGIYGSVAFRASRQRHEIGIRMALGAERGDLLRDMVWQGFRSVLIGAGIGVVGSLAITRLIQAQLFGVEPTDPNTCVAVSTILVISAVVATYLPARQATKVDPMVALRYE
jgi:ABC-type antimicrobial peptide transport system permease subunit